MDGNYGHGRRAAPFGPAQTGGRLSRVFAWPAVLRDHDPAVNRRFILSLAEYVDFLKNVTPNNQEEYLVQLRRFNLGIPGEADCPVFDGLFQYCQVRAKQLLAPAAARDTYARGVHNPRQRVQMSCCALYAVGYDLLKPEGHCRSAMLLPT